MQGQKFQPIANKKKGEKQILIRSRGWKSGKWKL
jgi:hypothetical protein